MIKYTISFHKQMNCYILWKECDSKHGFCVRGIYKGTYKECLEHRKDMILGEKYE